MGSPFDAGRDSTAATSNQFADAPEVADSHRDAFAASFEPPSDRLAEEDYRSAEHGGGSGDNTAAQGSGEFGYPTPRPGGHVNL